MEEAEAVVEEVAMVTKALKVNMKSSMTHIRNHPKEAKEVEEVVEVKLTIKIRAIQIILNKRAREAEDGVDEEEALSELMPIISKKERLKERCSKGVYLVVRLFLINKHLSQVIPKKPGVGN